MTSTWIRLYGVAVLKAAHENSLAEDPRDARLLLCLYQHLVSSACHDQTASLINDNNLFLHLNMLRSYLILLRGVFQTDHFKRIRLQCCNYSAV